MSSVKLRISYPNGRVEERVVPVGAYVIGRELGDIVLGDPNVSTRHAELVVQPGAVTIRDLGSTNGTFDPSGARLTAPYLMQPEQPIRLGASSISFALPVAAGGTQILAQVAEASVPGGGQFAPGPPPGASPYGGAPASPPYGYGGAPPGGAPAPFGQPPTNQGYGGAPSPNQGYGAAPSPNQGYGAPPSPNQGYGAPPTNQGYGGAPPPNQGYAGAPSPNQGYGAPPSPGQGFGGPPGYAPQGAPGYGPPPQGFGAPGGGYAAPGAPGMSIVGAAGGPPAEPAVWANRVIGFLLDYFIVAVVMIVLYGGVFVIGLLGAAGASAAGGRHGADVAGGLASSFCCVWIAIYPIALLLVGGWNRVYLVSTRGFSIGQGVMKLKVVDTHGNLLPMGTAAIRLLAQIGLAMVPFGMVLDLLWPLWDQRRQTLHDKAVNCYVINNPPAR